MATRLLPLTATEAEALRWLLDRSPAVVAEEKRDGGLRPVEARAVEADLLRVRATLQGGQR